MMLFGGRVLQAGIDRASGFGRASPGLPRGNVKG